MKTATFGVAGVCLMMAGCFQHGQPARNMARITLSQIVSYEQQVNAKIAKEREYYDKSRGKLEETLESDPGLFDAIDLRTLSQVYQGRIMDKRGAVNDIDLRGYAEAAINTVLISRAVLAKQLGAYKEQNFLALGELTYQKDGFKKVKKGLEELQAEPSDTKRLIQWYDLVKDIKMQYDAATSRPSGQ